MMIKVEAIVREEVFEDVKEALNAIDVNGITVSQVMGCGAQMGLWNRPRNGRKRPLMPFRRLHLPEKSGMERFSAMRSVLLQRSVPERAGLTP